MHRSERRIVFRTISIGAGRKEEGRRMPIPRACTPASSLPRHPRIQRCTQNTGIAATEYFSTKDPTGWNQLIPLGAGEETTMDRPVAGVGSQTGNVRLILVTAGPLEMNTHLKHQTVDPHGTTETQTMEATAGQICHLRLLRGRSRWRERVGVGIHTGGSPMRHKMILLG